MAYDIFHNYGFEKVKTKKAIKEGIDHVSYASACRLIDRHMKDLQDKYLDGDKSPSEILQSLGYKETPYDEHLYEFEQGDLTLVFDFSDYDWDDGPIVYYVLDSTGRIPDGYTRTKSVLKEPEDWTNEGCEDFGTCEEVEDNFLNRSFKRRFAMGDDDEESYESRNCSLTEAYNNLPSWFTNFLDNHVDGKAVKRVLSSRGIDLANATYIKGDMPRSNRDPVLKDESRLAIFRLNDGRGEIIYIKGVNNPYLRVNNAGRYGWEYKYANELPMKTILEMTTEYGYIDTNDSRNTNREVRRERAALKRAAGPERGKGQHPVERTIYSTDEYGRKDYNNPLGTEIEWVMTKNQDKSGYPLDPEKYKRMLDNVGLDTYGARLESYFKKIEALRTRIIAAMNQFSVDSSPKFRVGNFFSRNIYGDIGDATQNLAKAIDEYQGLKKECAAVVNRWEGKASREELDERIQELFKWNGKHVREYIEETLKAVTAIENAKEIPDEE